MASEKDYLSRYADNPIEGLILKSMALGLTKKQVSATLRIDLSYISHRLKRIKKHYKCKNDFQLGLELARLSPSWLDV